MTPMLFNVIKILGSCRFLLSVLSLHSFLLSHLQFDLLFAIQLNPQIKMVFKIRFFAISDFGGITSEILNVARAMNRYATEFQAPPDFIFGLGDNFYPYGVESMYDEQFQTTWRNTFLAPYPSLRVPWRMVLGNHDYMWNPYAQIEYSNNPKLNKDGLWYMPDHCYTFQYKVNSRLPPDASSSSEGKVASAAFPFSLFSSSSAAAKPTISEQKPSAEDTTVCENSNNEGENEENNNEVEIDFFAIDTNACQGHVVHSFPQTPLHMQRYMTQLKENLSSSKASWKVVFGHHPLYTQGKGHSAPASCLREKQYKSIKSDKVYQGFGLENILVDGKVDAYFSGHEHVFQVSFCLFFLGFSFYLSFSFL
jgi:hypothetical protein